MNVINLTPHNVNICDDSGAVVRTFPASGTYARAVTPEQATAEPVDGVPVVLPADFAGAQVEGLPDSDEPILVSILAAPGAARVYQGPVYTPDTGPASVVRDAGGHIVGVRRLVRYR